MITGLLLLGFVGYQLWGTGIEMARAQSDLRQRLESRVAVPVDEVDDIAADEPSTTSSDAASDRPNTEADSDSAERPVQPAPGSADDPVTESIDESSFAPISTGDPIARIEMPSLGTDHIVVAGIGVDELRLGPGHFPDTPLPGQLGNVAIAGHRTTYGQPFHDVDLLAPGDEIVLTTVTGRFVYLVDDISIVDPTEYAVVSTTDRTRARLTLTS
ncbi:MAG: sortase, partial [Ilumatobacteraceae bacterium]